MVNFEIYCREKLLHESVPTQNPAYLFTLPSANFYPDTTLFQPPHAADSGCCKSCCSLQMAHILWDESSCKWETCLELHHLCLKTSSNALNKRNKTKKHGPERCWAVLFACREWASCHTVLTGVILEKGEREGCNKNKELGNASD